MGRFEKQPENPRARGELSRAAENALWAVVEDLENLQQNVIRSLQEDVKRLQSEKNRLTDDIQHLLEEKEHLQQVRQITEQQVLIRQLAEVLAKHISSQLQSSLATLATQADENSYERSALKSAEVSNKVAGEINEKVEHMFGSLDDTVTITFNSLQQELKNYQSNLSQQLSRMYSQQQQGEEILTEFVNRLQGKLEKTIEETSRKAAAVSAPTVLQPTEPQKKSSETSPQLGEVARTAAEPISVIPRELPESKVTSKPPAAKIPPPIENVVEPISIISRESSQSETTPKPPAAKSPPIENVVEPISILSKDLSKGDVSPPAASTPQQGIKQPPPKQNVTEPISVIPRELSEDETISTPAAASTPQQGAKQSSLRRNVTEPISILSKESSKSDISPPVTPTPQKGVKQPPPRRNVTEPISVLSKDLSKSKTTLEPPTTPASRQRAKTSRSPSSQTLSSIQIGLLLVVLSTVISSLYNVAIKIIFHEGSQIFGVVEVERLLSPSLGNILLILTLRFMVVVPLMVLLAPILHPRVWQDIQNLADSVRGNSTPANATTQRILVMSVVSGCFLFVSQVLIYTAIGQVATGMAIALFFIYPIVSGLLGWFLFRDRPSALGASAIASICCGELLVLAGSLSTGMGNISLGSSAAIISGAAFAGYVILTRICADQLHPVTFTLINFATMLLLSFICLMLPLPGEWNLLVDPSKMLELVLSAFILGVLTLSGYLFNIFGTRNLGALQSPIIGASVPVLTVIFAGLIIQENLDIVQIMGVLLVTFGAAAFSLEKMRNQVKASSSTN
ncbi:EamA family transporter [Nostoc sp. B(2019)]|nr:EamA family transporter [Nostoc sp. B(2019)]